MNNKKECCWNCANGWINFTQSEIWCDKKNENMPAEESCDDFEMETEEPK